MACAEWAFTYWSELICVVLLCRLLHCWSPTEPSRSQAYPCPRLHLVAPLAFPNHYIISVYTCQNTLPNTLPCLSPRDVPCWLHSSVLLQNVLFTDMFPSDVLQMCYTINLG